MCPAPPSLRRLLPRAYSPFLGRFDAPREVQERAVPAIIGGADVLISSATASGKTEAYAAPAAEILLAHGAPSAGAIFVSPTRALANDLMRRLEGPMQRAGLSLGRYTGEHKRRLSGGLPAAVITTPESLDSLLARRAHVLADTRLVVVDEVHVLDNTARGDQLRILLHRLERAAKARPQRVAVSATMDDPSAFAARYLRDATRITIPGNRTIRARRFDGKGVASMADHLRFSAEHGCKKLLVFCRTRNEVETYSAKLHGKTRFADGVFAHHGSLSKTRRERTERLFLQAPAAVCFATLTLEMGIDIGGVDYVLVVGAPSGVASLLQRIGRGGRRTGGTRAGYVVEDEVEAHIVRTMFKLGAAGRLCDAPYGFRPSVLAQQAIVLCGADFLERGELLRSVPRDCWPSSDPAWEREALDEMVESGLLVRSGRGRWVHADEIERRWERGSVHSNISTTAGLEVVDRLTGDAVGRIQEPSTKRLSIGGGARAVARVDRDRVLTDAARTADATYFKPSMGPSVSFALAREIVRELGVPDGAIGRIENQGAVLLVHGLGATGGRMLAELLTQGGVAVDLEELSPYTLPVRGGSAEALDRLPEVKDEFVDLFVAERFESLEGRIGPGPFRRNVPRAWRERAARACAGIDEIVGLLRTLDVRPFEPTSIEIVRGL